MQDPRVSNKATTRSLFPNFMWSVGPYFSLLSTGLPEKKDKLRMGVRFKVQPGLKLFWGKFRKKYGKASMDIHVNLAFKTCPSKLKR